MNGTTVWQVKRLVGQVRVAPSQVPCCHIESGMVSQRLASSFAVVRMDPGLLAWRQRHAPSLQHTPGGQPAGATTTHLRQPRNVSGPDSGRPDGLESESVVFMLHGEGGWCWWQRYDTKCDRCDTVRGRPRPQAAAVRLAGELEHQNWNWLGLQGLGGAWFPAGGVSSSGNGWQWVMGEEARGEREEATREATTQGAATARAAV